MSVAIITGLTSDPDRSPNAMSKIYLFIAVVLLTDGQKKNS